jgi:hypothetical protein
VTVALSDLRQRQGIRAASSTVIILGTVPVLSCRDEVRRDCSVPAGGVPLRRERGPRPLATDAVSPRLRVEALIAERRGPTDGRSRAVPPLGAARAHMRALCSRAEYGVLGVKVDNETEALIYLRAVMGARASGRSRLNVACPGHYRRPTLRI